MVIDGNTRPATVSLVAYPMVETNFQFEPDMRHTPAAMTISRDVYTKTAVLLAQPNTPAKWQFNSI